MLSSRTKIHSIDEPVDPNQAVAKAILDAGRAHDASNKALIDAVKSIVMASPQVIVQEVSIPVPPARVPAAPRKWVFTVQRDDEGRMTHITAEAR